MPPFATDASARDRFLREARAAARVAHDNVVTVYEADERDGVSYLAMQLLQGCSLDEYLRRSAGALEVLRRVLLHVGGRAPLEPVLGERRDAVRIVLDRGFEAVAFAALERQRKRHLQDEEHECGDRQVAEEEPSGHRGGQRRKPTPRTVSIQAGSPSFLRNAAMCTSSVFVGPYQRVSHTDSRMS